jgi:hypothetical protein
VRLVQVHATTAVNHQHWLVRTCLNAWRKNSAEGAAMRWMTLNAGMSGVPG